MTPKEVLQKALEILGPNGENWGQVTIPRTKNCAGTAIINAVGINDSLVPDSGNKELMCEALRVLDNAILTKYPGRYVDANCSVLIINFNDHSSTTFPMIKEVFEAAIAAS